MSNSRSVDENDAAVLTERMRSGELSKSEIELASFLGHRGARELLGTESPSYYGTSEPILALAPWGRDVCLRAGAAAIRGAAALLDIEDDVIETDLDCAVQGLASKRPAPSVVEGLSLEGHLREASWTLADVCASDDPDWATRLDDAIAWLIAGTYGKLRKSGRWDESLWSRLSPVFPMPREEGEGGVWRAAVLSNVSATLVPWVLRCEK